MLFRSGNSQWVTVAVDQAMGANLSTRVDGLITGQVYNFQISRVNQLNPYLHADASLSSITAPADAAAPAAPTSLAITSQHLKSITFSWTAPADKDVVYYHWEIRTAASGGGSLVAENNTEGAGTKVALVLDTLIAYSTTRHLRIRAHDFSGNIGTYSSSLSFSFSQIGTGDMGSGSVTAPALGSGSVTNPALGSGAVDTGNIAGVAVTTAKRQLVNTQTSTTGVGAGVVANFAFTVATGATNAVVVAASGATNQNITVQAQTNNSTTVDTNAKNNHSASQNITVEITYW